jgi:hypothetical protein
MGPKGPDLHLQALSSQSPNRRMGADMVSGSGHAFIDSGHWQQPAGPPSARENRSTRPTHHGPLCFTTQNSGDDGYND